MDKYIGIDVHAASCTIAVVDARGKQIGSYVVATNGQEIMEAVHTDYAPSRRGLRTPRVSMSRRRWSTMSLRHLGDV